MTNRFDTKTLRQQIRYVKASDGTQLAWAQSGQGPTLVKAANWLTHLEYEWHSPVWKHWLEFFSTHFHFIRYDERGCGMSEWRPCELTIDQWAADLAAVIDAAQPNGPIILLGISQGAATCVTYALRHPKHVAAMILYGGYSRGPFRRNDHHAEDAFRAMADLARVEWGSDNPTFRQVFTSRFIPGGTPTATSVVERSVPEDDPWRNLRSASRGAWVRGRRGELSSIRVPTLVLHARDDAVCPLAEGRLLAACISGSEFVELDSRNHVLLEHEPAWARFKDAVLAFARPEHADDAAVFGGLSLREREVLALIADGLSNTEIASRLDISEKTVRNHTSNLFDKLGVWSRAQAIVFAREHGFRG